MKDGLGDFSDEVEVLKGQLGSQATTQATQRNKLVQLKEQVEEKKVRLAALNRKLIVTDKNLTDEQDKAKIKVISVEEADALLKDEVSTLAKAEKELKFVKEELFKHTEDLQVGENVFEGANVARVSGFLQVITNDHLLPVV